MGRLNGFALGLLLLTAADVDVVANETGGRTAAIPARTHVMRATCRTRGSQLGGDEGDSFWVACPSGCGRLGLVWGSANYSGDSAICAAAIHAGALTSDGGAVKVSLRPGRHSYRGSKKNNVHSKDFGPWNLSFAFSDDSPGENGQNSAATRAPMDAEPPAPTCYTRARDLEARVGDRLLLACPSGCFEGGEVWGSGVYAGESSLCRAALHAGALREDGGLVEVMVLRGRRSYGGGERNGIVSEHRSRSGQSFLLLKVGDKASARRTREHLGRD
jgi:hypothetical protein